MKTTKTKTKYRIQSPGYRYLEGHEILKPTDEWIGPDWHNPAWIRTECAGRTVGEVCGENCYRRKYNPRKKTK